MTAGSMSPSATRLPVPLSDALTAVVIALVVVAYHAAMGFPTLADSGGDNDSLMRLVRVRDLIAGQDWFDPMQYRMGLDGGFAMHWSRLVDLPIALLVAGVGEPAALVIWPAALHAAAMFFLLRAARNIGEAFVALPAAVIGGLALYHVNVFVPGALDHHNIQLVLALAMLVVLLRHEAPFVCGLLAGVFAALMLVVGMEAAPLVAVACASMAVSFFFGGDGADRRASGFGTGFGGVAVLCFLLTVPSRDWLAAQCDAFSLPQVSLAVIGGFGLATAAALPAVRQSRGAKGAGMCALALVAAGILLVAFPQCLSDPYAGLDPRLARYWLSGVTEAQPALSVLRADPTMFAAHYVTPVIALAVMPLLWRRPESREMATMAALLAAAFLLSLWQVRGALFSLPLAAIPLSAWVAQARARASSASTLPAQLAMVATWLVSFNIVWQTAVQAATGALAQKTAGVEMSSSSSACTAKRDYAELAAQPDGTVLAISNLGSPILANTPHRVLAGPYHRNVEGNLAALTLLMGDPKPIEAEARRLGIDYVIDCPGNGETAALRNWAPAGLASLLSEGNVPAWLEPIDTETAVRLYRVSSP